MKILSIDSSTKAASASIIDNDKIISEYFLNTGFTHSETLMPMINSALEQSAVKLSDIDLIAVTLGPGSFTGVRIGVASAKGLAFSGNIPTVGVSALETLAYNLSGLKGECLIYAVIDARCGQVYNAAFKYNEGAIERITDDRVIKITDLALEIKNADSSLPIYLLGDGTYPCLKEEGFPEVLSVPAALNEIRASSAAFLAKKIYSECGAQDSASIQPIYLQLPQATRELKKKTENKA